MSVGVNSPARPVTTMRVGAFPIPITIDLKAQNGVLIGLTPSNGPTYVISVSRGYQSPIL
jgi:hypothetical protein